MIFYFFFKKIEIDQKQTFILATPIFTEFYKYINEKIPQLLFKRLFI